MIVEEILSKTRVLMDDAIAPFLWSDSELVDYLNESVNELCKKTGVLTDGDTPSVCNAHLFSGDPTFILSPLVTDLIAANLASNGLSLHKRTVAWVNNNVSNWRVLTGTPGLIIPKYARGKGRIVPFYDDDYVLTGSSNIAFDQSDGTIACPAGGLSIFPADCTIQISGTLSNNGIFTVLTSSDTELEISQDLVDELLTSAVIEKSVDNLDLFVARLPLEKISITDLSVEPELDDQYHFGLIHGIMKYGYLKRDAETFNPAESIKAGNLFDQFMEDIKLDEIRRNEGGDVLTPHYGAI